MIARDDIGAISDQWFRGLAIHARSMPEDGIQLYKVIVVRGPDAADFLQGQLTQDVDRLNEDEPLFAAWCNPKGRVIVTSRLARIDDGIAMVVAADMTGRVLELMQLYRFRAKVETSVVDSDPAELVEPWMIDPLALIESGVPSINAQNTEAFTPHMLNLDRLDAISFSKGCYTGQEIVARTEHRGSSKRRMMRYEADMDGIEVGASVFDGARAVGEVVNVAGSALLAVTPVDSHAQSLTAGPFSLAPLGLPYEI